MTKTGGYKPDWGYLDKRPSKETADDRYTKLITELESLLLRPEFTGSIADRIRLSVWYKNLDPKKGARKTKIREEVGTVEEILSYVRNRSLIDPQTGKQYTVLKTSYKALIAYKVTDLSTGRFLFMGSKKKKV